MSIDGFRTLRATCLLAPNPAPMTLDGTNTWLIAEPGSPSVVVIDPGPDDEEHLRRVHAEAVAGDRRVARIVLTHGHLDHSAGAARLAELTGAPVQAADPARRLGPEGLADGDVITASGCELRVVAAPGHSADSVCLPMTPCSRVIPCSAAAPRCLQRARLRRRSVSRMSTERAEICSQPRAAKSASALLTVSLEAPTSWASSSCVRS